MSFAGLAAIHTSRAVVLAALGQQGRALECAEAALEAMDCPLRLYAHYWIMGVFVQLIPVSGRGC